MITIYILHKKHKIILFVEIQAKLLEQSTPNQIGSIVCENKNYGSKQNLYKLVYYKTTKLVKNNP